MKSLLGILFLSGCLFLTVNNIYAVETTESQKQSLKIPKHTLDNAKEESDVTDFTDNLFLGLEENDIVYQVNGGGFLSSTVTEHKTLKKQFEESNRGVKLKAVTVSQAKNYYKKQLEKHFVSEKQR